MRENFSASLSHTLAAEGGYSRNPRDPGGPTNEGVTQSVYTNWRETHGQQPRDVREIDPNEIEAIYRSLYWNGVKGDDLPSGVDYCVFDAAVNSGCAQASRWLQRAADVADDGIIGPVTLMALRGMDPRFLIHAVCSERLQFLQRLSTWPEFGNGWAHRVATVEYVARGMT